MDDLEKIEIGESSSELTLVAGAATDAIPAAEAEESMWRWTVSPEGATGVVDGTIARVRQRDPVADAGAVELLALVQGACVGGGLEIAACCDMRICGESSRFGVPIAMISLVDKAQEMSSRYTTLWKLLQKLSKVNWEILKLENE